MIRNTQIIKIQSLKNGLNINNKEFNRFLTAQYGVTSLLWLNKKQANEIIKLLNYKKPNTLKTFINNLFSFRRCNYGHSF